MRNENLHDAASSLRFILKTEQDESVFEEADVFVSLPTILGKSLWYILLPKVTYGRSTHSGSDYMTMLTT